MVQDQPEARQAVARHGRVQQATRSLNDATHNNAACNTAMQHANMQWVSMQHRITWQAVARQGLPIILELQCCAAAHGSPRQADEGPRGAAPVVPGRGRRRRPQEGHAAARGKAHTHVHTCAHAHTCARAPMRARVHLRLHPPTGRNTAAQAAHNRTKFERANDKAGRAHIRKPPKPNQTKPNQAKAKRQPRRLVHTTHDRTGVTGGMWHVVHAQRRNEARRKSGCWQLYALAIQMYTETENNEKLQELYRKAVQALVPVQRAACSVHRAAYNLCSMRHIAGQVCDSAPVHHGNYPRVRRKSDHPPTVTRLSCGRAAIPQIPPFISAARCRAVRAHARHRCTWVSASGRPQQTVSSTHSAASTRRATPAASSASSK